MEICRAHYLPCAQIRPAQVGLGFQPRSKAGEGKRSTHCMTVAPANPWQASEEVRCGGALEQAGGVRYLFEVAGRRGAH
jgi:hypothetical protein